MPNKEDLDQELDEFMSQNNNRVGNSPKTPGIFGNSIPSSVRDPRLKSREIPENVIVFTLLLNAIVLLWLYGTTY